MLRMTIIGLCAMAIVAAFAGVIGYFGSTYLAGPPPNVFRGRFLKFELPPKWKCELEETTWVCQLTVDNKMRKAAIIIMTAKERGPQDSFEAYEKHLAQPRDIVTRDGKNKMKSKILHLRRTNIGGRTWVDSQHLSSEIPHYYTRYLAALMANHAILVTFSVHKSYGDRFNAVLQKAVESLQINQRG